MYWIGVQAGSPSEPLISPTFSFTSRASCSYSGTSLRDFGVIWM